MKLMPPVVLPLRLEDLNGLHRRRKP